MLSDAETLSLAREMWPSVTIAYASDAFLLAWLPMCRDEVDACLFGSTYDMAVACLLAHYAMVVDPGGTGAGSGVGALASLSTGRISVSYLSDDSIGGTHGTTKPGQAFDRLAMTHRPGPMMVEL